MSDSFTYKFTNLGLGRVNTDLAKDLITNQRAAFVTLDKGGSSILKLHDDGSVRQHSSYDPDLEKQPGEKVSLDGNSFFSALVSHAVDSKVALPSKEKRKEDPISTAPEVSTPKDELPFQFVGLNIGRVNPTIGRDLILNSAAYVTLPTGELKIAKLHGGNVQQHDVADTGFKKGNPFPGMKPEVFQTALGRHAIDQGVPPPT
jgi:hypothetical protein